VSHPVRFLKRAHDWVRREAGYIDAHRPEAARNFLAAIERAHRQLSEYPMSGSPGLIPDTRRLVVGPYILSYRVRRGVVEVFAVRHGPQRDARAPVE
jgi:plasmid stabilization system protein ParE